MRKLLLIALTLTGLSAKAQYFQHVYGTTIDDSLTSGINTTVVAPGYFKAGVSDFSCIGPAVSAIPATFSDINGNVGFGYFNRQYILTNASGGFINAYDPQVFEFDNGTGFGIVGRYQDPYASSPNTGVFYLQLNTAGTPVGVFRYPVSTSGLTWDVIEVGAVRESVSGAGDSIYVTGTAWNTTWFNRHFALKIDVATGGLGWGWVYNLTHPLPWTRPSWGRDIIESPYGAPWFPAGYEDVVIAGFKEDSMYMPSIIRQGFIQHADAGTGMPNAPAPPVFYYGQPNANTHLNAITVANDIVAGPAGFAMAGGTDEYGNMDYYMLRIDPHGNMVVGSVAIDYAWNPGSNNDGFDVIERLDSLGNYTYIATGYTENGKIGARDAMTVKTNNFLTPIAGGEFTYGGTNDDYGKALDLINNNGGLPPDGLSTFGTWGSGGGVGGDDLYLVRSYYNGISGCNEAFNTSPYQPSGPMFPHAPADTLTHFDQGTLNALYVTTSDVTFCFSFTIGGGSNARVGNGTTNGQVLLVPNPSENGNTAVKLNVETENSGKADVVIYDMMGKEVYAAKFTLVKGSNQLPLDIKTTLAAGMYSVVMTHNGEKQTTMMVVK